MKSVRVVEGSTRFAVETIEAPSLRPGSALVRIEAAFLPPFMQHLPGGGWATPPRPFTPGQCAIGVIEAVDDPAGALEPGQRVYCDMYIESHGAKTAPDHGFIGCFGVAPGAAAHLAEWPNGTFAEHLCAPTECFTPIPESAAAAPEILCRIGWFGTAYAGLERGGFRPGMTLAINGAAGMLGSSAALLALALGAAEVRLHGRRLAVMEEIAVLSPRLAIVADSDDAPIDMLLDCAGGEDVTTTEALVSRLRRFGTAAFVGALSAPLKVDSSWLMRNGNALVGSFWFPRETAGRVLALVAAGALDLSPLRAETFPFDDIEVAMRASVERSGGLSHVALVNTN